MELGRLTVVSVRFSKIEPEKKKQISLPFKTFTATKRRQNIRSPAPTE
jgi:hypothetical protein